MDYRHLKYFMEVAEEKSFSKAARNLHISQSAISRMIKSLEDELGIILFNRNASSGGLDIVAKILNKYAHIDLGKAMSLSGMCVALSAALVYDKKTVVLSILGTYFNGMVLDHFIFDHNIKRRVCIITKKEEKLRNFIIHDLHSGATIYESIGAYNMQKRNEIITIVDKSEYQKLMNYITKEDPQAFVTVYNVSSMRYQPKL